MAPRRRQRRRRGGGGGQPTAVVVEPIATRVSSSLALDWNVTGSTSSVLQKSLPSAYGRLAWKVTSVEITVASTGPEPFILQLYGATGPAGIQYTVDITARTRTLLATTYPTQIRFRNGRSVQHASSDTASILAALVPANSDYTITVTGVVRLSIVGSLS